MPHQMHGIRSFGDNRVLAFCVYCGGATPDTVDHVPSRVFLDEPYPENLPTVPACRACNENFSPDEEYLACIFECIIAGTTNPKDFQRAKAARTASNQPSLMARLTKAHDGAAFSLETERLKRIVLKLARGHAAFDLHLPQTDEPFFINCMVISDMSESQIQEFYRSPPLSLLPEVGSRAMQKLIIGDSVTVAWTVIQSERYRYLATIDGGPLIRFVLNEYLACEVRWDEG